MRYFTVAAVRCQIPLLIPFENNRLTGMLMGYCPQTDV
jgi:hypothetical protein